MNGGGIERGGTAVVLGASGGIGAAIADALDARGEFARVVRASRQGADPGFAFDLGDEDSIAALAARLAEYPPVRFAFVATGALTIDGRGPERSYRKLEPEALARAFALNSIGPALLAKHLLPLFPKEGRSVMAFLSARVGSIADNRLGGWHAYRASKAALNMLVRNFAIEQARTHPGAVIAALHPGTVATALSAPFQRNLPEGQLTTPDEAADHLLKVLDGLSPAQSGGLFAWDGQAIPF